MLYKYFHLWSTSFQKLVSIWLSTIWRTTMLMKLTSSSRIWNVCFLKNTSWKQLSMLLLVKLAIRRITWELLKTSSKWLERPHLSVIRSQVVNVWHLASSSWNNLTMCLFILRVFVLTSSMMMTSIGTLVSLLPQLKNTKMEKKVYYKFKMKSISKNTVTYLGFADVTSWTRSLISLGRSTSIWKPQTKVCLFSTLLQMTATKWDSSISPWKLLMSLKGLMQTLNSGKVREEQPSEYSRWCALVSRARRGWSKWFRC